MARWSPPRRSATLAAAFLVSLVLLPANVARAAPLFSDGFESGTLASWSSSAGIEVQSGIVFAGSFAARATTTGAAEFAMKNLGTGQSDLYMDTRVHVVSVGGTTTLLRFKTSTGAKVLSLNVKTNGALQVKNHVTGAIDTSATDLPSASWHELQLHASVAGLLSLVEVWLDGTPVGDLGGIQNLGTSPLGRVEIASSQASSGFDVVFDEVVVDTAFIGGGGDPPPTPTNLRTTLVNANRVDLAWDASSGANTYRVYRDGLQIGSSPTTSFQDTTVQPETQYSYAVDACNANGCSAQTAPLLVTTPPPGGGDVVVMTAGDIACDPANPDFNNGNGTSKRCRQKFTAPLLAGADAVLAIGDTQYDCAGTAAYAQSYDPTWGQYKAITYPIVGDEEYATDGTDCGAPGADGYFGYFGAVAHPETGGYYSFDLGAWHVVALNSECADIDDGAPGNGCVEGSPQNDWLEADLAANDSTCTLAFLHRWLFASRKTGSQVNADMRVFWDDLYAAGVDIILAGNAHMYERFEPQDPQGQPDPNGIAEFIVGVGGKSHGGLALPANRLPTSETGTDKSFGVLKLTLHPTSYEWRFLSEPGSPAFTDLGSADCH